MAVATAQAAVEVPGGVQAVGAEITTAGGVV
jgi:hypothetical protein